MSIFARVSDIFKANVNEILDRMEDPEKMVKQMIIEMEEALVKATSALAKAMANERNLRKQQENALSQAKQWEEKAAMALKAGNADLAKQALSKKIIADGQAKQYDAMVAQASSVTSQLRSQLDTLKTRLDEARMKQATLVARAQTAKTQKEFSTVMGVTSARAPLRSSRKWRRRSRGWRRRRRRSRNSPATPLRTIRSRTWRRICSLRRRWRS